MTELETELMPELKTEQVAELTELETELMTEVELVVVGSLEPPVETGKGAGTCWTLVAPTQGSRYGCRDGLYPG